jgi:hypothetical protein
MLAARLIAAHIWRQHGQELVVTSSSDGEHTDGSRHYVGDAEDYRTRYFDAPTQAKVAEELRERLGSEYRVILEPTHCHVQWSP